MNSERILLSSGEIVVDSQVAKILHTCARRAAEINPEDMLNGLAEVPGLFAGFASTSEIKQTLAETVGREETPYLQIVPIENYPVSGWTEDILSRAEQESNGAPIKAEHVVLGMLDHQLSRAAYSLRRLGNEKQLAQRMRQRIASQAA